MPLVHQAVASFVPHDAVSNAAIRFRRMLDEISAGRHDTAGFHSGRILAEGIHRSLRAEAIPFEELAPGAPDDVIVYHVSTDSEIADWLTERPERIVLYYHNLTPSLFFAPYDPMAARRLQTARVQLERLAEIAGAAAAPSDFSLEELRRLGVRNLHKVSYPVTPLTDTSPAPRDLRSGVGSTGDPIKLLFVGRITPNKGYDQLLRLAALVRKQGVDCDLRLVGGVHLPLYKRYLEELSRRLGLEESSFIGTVSTKRLRAHYAEATFFVSFSNHEGFFVPAVEAMQQGLPVIALARAAVTETVGDGGVLIPENDIAVFCAVILELIESPDGYRYLSSAGMERAKSLCDKERLKNQLLEFLRSIPN